MAVAQIGDLISLSFPNERREEKVSASEKIVFVEWNVFL